MTAIQVFPVVTATIKWHSAHQELEHADVVQLGLHRYGVLSCEERWSAENGMETVLRLVESEFWPIAFPQLCAVTP